MKEEQPVNTTSDGINSFFTSNERCDVVKINSDADCGHVVAEEVERLVADLFSAVFGVANFAADQAAAPQAMVQ